MTGKKALAFMASLVPDLRYFVDNQVGESLGVKCRDETVIDDVFRGSLLDPEQRRGNSKFVRVECEPSNLDNRRLSRQVLDIACHEIQAVKAADGVDDEIVVAVDNA